MLKKLLLAIVVLALVAVGAQADDDQFTGTTSTASSSTWIVTGTGNICQPVCDIPIFMDIVRQMDIDCCTEIVLVQETPGDNSSDFVGCCAIGGTINFAPSTMTLTVEDANSVPNNGWECSIHDWDCNNDGANYGACPQDTTIVNPQLPYNACIREACVKMLDPNILAVQAGLHLQVGTAKVTLCP